MSGVWLPVYPNVNGGYRRGPASKLCLHGRRTGFTWIECSTRKVLASKQKLSLFKTQPSSSEAGGGGGGEELPQRISHPEGGLARWTAAFPRGGLLPRASLIWTYADTKGMSGLRGTSCSLFTGETRGRESNKPCCEPSTPHSLLL